MLNSLPWRWPQSFACLILLTALTTPIQALYFYLESSTPKCFYEELPKDTLVVGHYASHLHDPQTNTFTLPQDLTITITVDEVFSNDHRVYNSRAASTGKFTFSAADSGDHRICFTPSLPSYSSGWSGSFTHSGGKGIKVELDLVVGETSKIESEDKGKMSEIAQKVKDLNARLLDIKREQVFQREREAEFRDQSEATNAKVIRWTLVQLLVLAAVCSWQLSHLRAFFIKQKLT